MFTNVIYHKKPTSFRMPPHATCCFSLFAWYICPEKVHPYATCCLLLVVCYVSLEKGASYAACSLQLVACYVSTDKSVSPYHLLLVACCSLYAKNRVLYYNIVQIIEYDPMDIGDAYSILDFNRLQKWVTVVIQFSPQKQTNKTRKINNERSNKEGTSNN